MKNFGQNPKVTYIQIKLLQEKLYLGEKIFQNGEMCFWKYLEI